LAQGCPEPHRIIDGQPPHDDHPFVVWGQEWLTLRIVPGAVQRRRPFWTMDNGYWNPARGGPDGYYRFCYRGFSPVLLDLPILAQSGRLQNQTIEVQPWRHDGVHVVLAMPGIHFGMALGLNVQGWCRTIGAKLRSQTKRPICVRPRDSRVPLQHDLAGAWALVTHSSNVAVDAAIAGIPVFVAVTSPAAPIGRLDLEIETVVTPDRGHWLASLASQHFTLAEMADGTAWRGMQRIARQVDEKAAASALSTGPP
jgi:hypothetical protein